MNLKLLESLHSLTCNQIDNSNEKTKKVKRGTKRLGQLKANGVCD